MYQFEGHLYQEVPQHKGWDDFKVYEQKAHLDSIAEPVIADPGEIINLFYHKVLPR